MVDDEDDVTAMVVPFQHAKAAGTTTIGIVYCIVPQSSVSFRNNIMLLEQGFQRQVYV